MAQLSRDEAVRIRNEILRHGTCRETARMAATRSPADYPLKRIHVYRLDGQDVDADTCGQIVFGLLAARATEEPFGSLLQRLMKDNMWFHCDVVGFNARLPGGKQEQAAQVEVLAVTDYADAKETFRTTGHSLSAQNINYRVYFFWKTPSQGNESTSGNHSDAELRAFEMPVEDVFFIQGRGTVVTGRIQSGCCRKGQAVLIRKGDAEVCRSVISGIEAFNRTLEVAVEGDNVGLVLADTPHKILEKGMVVLPA